MRLRFRCDIRWRAAIWGGFLLVLGLVSQPQAFAQRHYVESYSLEDGLPQSQVRDILQDERGYLWLAMFSGGLARFDGHIFETFTTKDGLPSNTTVALHEDSSGTLWIGTRGGLARYDGTTIEAFTEEEGALPSNQIRMIASGTRGKLWVGTLDGVVSYDGVKFVPLAPVASKARISRASRPRKIRSGLGQKTACTDTTRRVSPRLGTSADFPICPSFLSVLGQGTH